MQEFEVNVIKLTDVSLAQRACSFTISKESHITLSKLYKYGHSPIRTQLFWVELRNIPLFVASQLVRSQVGVQFFQTSKRIDRGGEDFREVCENILNKLNAGEDVSKDIESLPDRFDRYAPTDLAFIINAEALINMSHKRLCNKASIETREIVGAIKEKIKTIDPELYKHLVPMCIYRGGICSEPNGCGLNKSEIFKKMLENYLK